MCIYIISPRFFYVEDLVDEMVDDVVIPSMMMGAKYEDYLLGTAFARPIIVSCAYILYRHGFLCNTKFL